MNEIPDDILLFSPDNLLKQVAETPLVLGYHTVRFYVENSGILAKEPTGSIGVFYLSPSGGTLRDAEMNIVLYSAKYDKFKGWGKA